MRRNTLFKVLFIGLPDVLLFSYLLAVFTLRGSLHGPLFYPVIPVTFLLLLARVLAFLWVSDRYYFRRINQIKKIVGDFKKGRYLTPNGQPGADGEMAGLYRDLTVIGKHVDAIVSAQKAEIEQLRELYNNIVLSMSSYFIVLDQGETIIYANESFCKKFQYDKDDLIGKNVDDVFVFLTGRIKEAVTSLRHTGESIILEKAHLLTKNRISIIADIKISRIVVKGIQQVVMVIDDITTKCRKDYQISLISQISESIQRDAEIDKVLYTILTGVTSGSGLGFNRAMLFLLDENDRTLAGKMAVGPDSLEEAVEIWSSIHAERLDLYSQMSGFDAEPPKGRKLLQKTLSTGFSVKEKNILVQCMEKLETVHVTNAAADDRVENALREFIDANEFVIVPLVAVNRAIGVIIADNKFNQVPIGTDSIELLTIFAFQAALSIESYKNLSLMKKEMRKITDRQEAIVETEKMAAVGRITSHIAHEIRNPLVTMGGYANRILQLSKDGSRSSDTSIRNSAKIILKESERLEKVLGNVLDFTRPSPYIREFNNINDVVNDTMELLRNLLQEHRITAKLNLRKDMPLIKSDFNQLKQVMLNLLQNAIDATPFDGSIEITTGVNGKNVELSVRDTGSGIRDEDLGRVFEPFFSTKETGVGLGLAIVKKIISDHGGEITVRNRPGGGAEFSVVLAMPG